MKKLGVCLLSIFIFFILSCEIGLGASVDTEAPTLEITNPPSDAIIRDDFAIQGSWTDDGSLSSVSVEMVRLENGQKTSFTGSFVSTSDKNNSGNWNIVISPKESGLLDGTYEAVVAITDNGEHTTTMARTFTIDNTPPVMILQKPSTTISDAANRFDTFGQIFSIVGQASDDSLIDKIDVSVYSDVSCSDSSLLKTITLDNVPPTIDLDVARFVNGTANDYSAIYGATSLAGQSAPRYFKLQIYDNAKKYNADGSVETIGNKQESYYLYKDVSDLITEYKATGLYKILSGNKSPNSASTMTRLESEKRAVGKFKLNPDNSPTYIVSARTVVADGDDLDKPLYQLTSGNNCIEIQIDPGLDSNPIEEDTIGIYLKECNLMGEPLTNARKLWLIRPVVAASPEFENDVVADGHSESKATITPSGDSYKFKTLLISSITYPELQSDLQINHNYRIYVTGKDRNDMEVIPRNDNSSITSTNPFYAFKLASSGEKIELIPSASPVYVTSNEKTNGINPDTLETELITSATLENTLTITLQYQGGSVPYTFQENTGNGLVDITNNSNLTKNVTSTPMNAVRIINQTSSPSLNELAGSGTASIEYQIECEGASSNVKSISFIIDNTPPVITYDSLKINTNSYNASVYYDKQYLNISGECNEPNLETIYYYVDWPNRGAIPSNLSVTNDGEISKFTAADGTNATNTNYKKFEFKAVEFKDNETAANGSKIPNRLFIQAKDKAGNLSQVKQYTINIDTSLPEFEAKYYKIGTGNLAVASGTVYVLNDSEITLYGNYKDGQSGVDRLAIKRDTTVINPDASGSTVSTGILYSTTEITDEASVASANFESYSSISDKASIRSWKAVFTPGATGVLKVTGKNLAGKSDTKNVFTMSLDNEDPQLQNLKLKEITGTGATEKEAFKKDSDSKYYVNNTAATGKVYKITGLATDNYGVAKVGIAVTNTGTSSPSTFTPLADITNPTGTWEFDISEIIGWSGSATVVITATDKSGRTSSAASGTVEIVFDTTAETPDSDKFVTPSPTETESSRFIFEGQSGSVSDSKSGLDKVEIAFTSNNSQPSHAQANVTPASDGTWTSTVEFANSVFENVFVSPTGTEEEGTKYLWVRVYDKAGNVSNWASKAFIYDKHAPEIDFTSTTPGANAHKKEGFAIEVTASDISGIQSVSGSYPGLATSFDLTPVAGETDKYKKEFVVGDSNVDAENYLADGAYSFTITATDNAGKPNSVTRTITVDTTNPSGVFDDTTIPPAVPVTVTDVDTDTTEVQKWYKATSVRFNLNVTEANIATVGITKNSADDSSYEAMSGTSSGSTGIYAGTVTSLSEGINIITAKITDLAGNEGTATTNVYVDTTAPVLAVNGNLSYMPEAGFYINGTASDSGSGIKTLIVKEEHRADVSADWAYTAASGANGVSENATATWTKHLPLGTGTIPSEGLYRYTIILKDKAENEKTVSFETAVDTTAPVINITNPGTGNNAKMGQTAIDSSPYQFKGGVDEANEVSSIYYKILSNAENAPSAPEGNKLQTSTWTSADWTYVSSEAIQTGSFSWAFYRDIKTGTNPLAEGMYKIHMFALDGAGNLSNVTSQEFHVDMAVPVVTATAPEYVNSTTNASAADPVAELRKVTISGTVTESHGLQSFYIKRNDEAESSNGTSVAPAADGTWSFSDIPAADGTYTYTITATDLVGKTNTPLTKTVVVDTTVPEFAANSLKVKDVNWNVSKYYKDTTLKMSGNFTDATSGVDTLYYYVQYPGRTGTVPSDLTARDAEDNSVADDSVSLSQNQTDNTKYDFNFTVVDYKNNTYSETDGTSTANTLYIQAVDKAGNKSVVTNYTVNVDTTEPELSTKFYQISGAPKATSSTVYVKTGATTITIYGNYKDLQSGVKGLAEFKVGDDSISPVITYSASVLTDEVSSIPSSFEYENCDTTNEKLIRSWKAVLNLNNNSGKVEFEGRNGTYTAGSNDGKKSESPFTIKIDNGMPSLSNISITPSSNTVAYKMPGTENYYINNSEGTTFTFAGIAVDNYGVDTVQLEILKPKLGATGLPELNNGNVVYEVHGEPHLTEASEWSFDSIGLTGLYGTVAAPVKALITVTDIAGNETEKELKLVFDTTAPHAMHWADSKNKDVYFRIGNADNDRKSTDTTSDDYNKVETGDTWDEDLDEGVGNKYAFGSYGNDSTIELRGTFEETGSGLKAVHYKIFSGVPDSSSISSLGTTTNPYDGDITVIAGETRRVPYNVAGSSTKSSMEVTSNFHDKIAGFNGDNNYLVLVAEDNVGNLAADTLAVYGGPDSTTGDSKWNSADHNTETNYFSLNKDTKVPVITTTTSTQATDGSKEITVTGTVSDNDAGIKSVTISIDESVGSGSTAHTITYTAEAAITATRIENEVTKDGNWTVTIPSDTFDIENVNEANVTVYATARDNAGAGNTKTISAATVIIDKLGPELVIDSSRIKDADDTRTGTYVNNTIEIKGTAYDTNGIRTEVSGAKTLKMYYTTAPQTANDDGTYPVPTTITKGTTEASAWVELPEAKAEHSANWTISLDTTAIASGTIVKTVFLIVEGYDAAGNVGYSAPVKVIVDQDTDRPIITLSNLILQASGTSYLKNSKTLYLSVKDDDGVASTTYAIDNGTSQNFNGSSITINGEGQHTIVFTVTDTAGTTFTSSSTTLPTPKITDGTTTRGGNLIFNLANKAPEVKNIEYRVFNALEQNVNNQWSAWATSAGTVGGPKFTKVKVRIKASSAQFVASATGTYNGNEYEFTCDDTSHNDVNDHWWTSPEIPVGSTLNGNQDIELSVKDAIPDDPMESTPSAVIKVDNTAPVIDITKPSSLIGQDETIKGEVNEDVVMYYAVSRYCKLKNDGTPNETDLYEVDDITPDSDTESKTASDGSTVLATKWTELVREDVGTKWYVYFDDKLKTGSTTEYETDHTAKLGTYLTEDYLGITTKAAVAAGTNPYESRTPVYFWIKAVDACGNEKIEKQKLDIDPQGERPIVEISYPANVVNNSGVSEVPTLGGTIRMTGTATDNNSAKYVWVQIDRDETEGFSQEELTYLKDNNYKIGRISTNTHLTAAQVPTDLGDGANAAADYGIMVEVKGTGWSQTLNSDGEFNNTGSTATIKITVYATDADATPHKSLPATQTVILDSRIPYVEQSSLEFVQYNANGSIKNRKPYTADARISGIWYLTGNIKDDDSGIAKIKHNGNERIASTGTEYTSTSDSNYWFKKITKTVNGNTMYDYQFSIPLGNITPNSVGTDTAAFIITENVEGGSEIQPSYTVVYDNKAPVLVTSDNNLVNLERNVQNSNGFYTFGAIAAEASVGEGENAIDQSGVERIAFYFTRDLEYGLHGGTNSRDLFDAMIYHKNTDTDDIASGNMITGYDSSLALENGLYWHSISGSVSSKTFTYTGSAQATKNIHKKGLAKINGSIYLIDDVSESSGTVTVTLDEAPGDGTATALFAVCNVIDHGGEKNGNSSTSTTQGYGYGYYGTRVTDDGDLITESFSKQGTDWIFDASINSKNLPDGPITLHIVAFDKAGNFAEWASTPAAGQTGTDLDFVVSNNAPRIAGMLIGTDEDGNNHVDDSEFITSSSNIYNLGYDKSGNEMTNVTFPTQTSNTPTAILTVKGLTVVKPEIVGGNGAIKYTYKVYKHSNNQTWEANAEYSKTTSVTIANGTTDVVADLIADVELPISDFIGKTNGSDTNQISDGNNKKFVFSFGDSTPGRTQTSGTSNSATLNVIMNVALRETTKARNWILPFYWKNKSENSLFKQSSSEGHIELASDWILADGYDASKDELDSDPKVSGKIKIEGVAYDDTLLREIKVKLGTAMSTDDGLTTTDTVIANYKFTTGQWGTGTGDNFVAFGSSEPTVIPDSGWVSYVKQATYGDLMKVGLITEYPTENNVVKTENDLVPYTSQEHGHVVHWILYVDTAKITGVAEKNITVTTTATDRGKPTWSGAADSGSVGYTTNGALVTGTPESGTAPFSGAVTKSGSVVSEGDLTGAYRVDVVPYIAGVKTGLSKLKKGNSSAYDRTALGHYPVASTETVYVYGFNLDGGTLYDSKATSPASTALTSVDAVSQNWYSANAKPEGSVYSLDSIANFVSGPVYVKVNNIETLNNKNMKDAKGSFTETVDLTVNPSGNKSVYENYYNCKPNGDNNNLLTDDVVFDVWQITPQAVKPINGYATQPVMAINPVSHDVGFAFVNSTLYFSMPNGKSNTNSDNKSYKTWIGGLDFWTSVGLAYDSFGNSYATTAGGDINNGKADTFRIMTSRWGIADLTPDKGYNKGDNNYRLEYIAQGEYSGSDTATTNFNKERIRSPSIAAVPKSTTSADGTRVYLAYYDEINDEIRFKHGEFSDSKIKNWYKYTHDEETAEAGANAFFGDFYGCVETADRTPSSTYEVTENGVKVKYKYVEAEDKYVSEWLGKTTVAQRGGWYTLAHNSLIAGQTKNKEYRNHIWGKNAKNEDVLVAQTRQSVTTAVTTTSGNPVYAGKYVSIAAIPNGGTSDDAVVAVWWDAENSQLLYSYNLTPNSIQVGQYSQADTKWTTPVAIFGAGNSIGEYCKLALDKDNGVHVAAYDGLNGDLYYAYLSDFKSPSAAKTCIVDSYGIIGTELNIDVALDENNKPVPYISYYAGNCARPKIAYWSDAKDITTDDFAGGADDELSTGEWEISIIPTGSKVSVDHINVGVWKDSDGKIDWSTTDGATPSGTNIGTNSFTSGTSGSGMVYGNGTKNPILGYAITQGSKGYIETAQMK